MARGNASGIRVTPQILPTIIAMIARGDRHHDIAAWFGLNQGRIKDAQDGKYGPPTTSPNLPLPPKGPPGPKGKRMRDAAEFALAKLNSGDFAGGKSAIQKAIGDYDTDET